MPQAPAMKERRMELKPNANATQPTPSGTIPDANKAGAAPPVLAAASANPLKRGGDECDTAPPLRAQKTNANETQPQPSGTIPDADTAVAASVPPAASADAAPPPKPELPSPQDKCHVNVLILLQEIIAYNTHYLRENMKTQSMPMLRDWPDIPLHMHKPLPITNDDASQLTSYKHPWQKDAAINALNKSECYEAHLMLMETGQEREAARDHDPGSDAEM